MKGENGGGTGEGLPVEGQNTISSNIDLLTKSLEKINKLFEDTKTPEGTSENPLTMENLTGKK